jgi:hypothetical protein
MEPSNSFTDDTTVRDFFAIVAAKMKRTPQQVEKFVVGLEENWIETVANLRQVEDAQWKELGLPMALANQVKALLNEG